MTSSLFVQTRAIMTGADYSPVGAIFPVEGTVYPGAPNPPSFDTDDGDGYWCGFASAVAGGLANIQDGLWACPTNPAGWTSNFCGVGYEALTVPMWPSVQQGRANLNMLLGWYANTYYMQHGGSYEGMVIVGSAWSQGVMVWAQTFFLDILPPTGTLHYLLPYVWRQYWIGDPMRCPGVAHGNEMAGQPLPPKHDGVITGGIAGPLDYTVAQANLKAPDGAWLINSFVNPGDLYADSPCGPTPWTKLPSSGSVEYKIFKIVMQPSFADIVGLVTLLGHPIGDIMAMINAGTFFAAGNNAPHYQYFPALTAIIDDALALGNSLPHARGF
jgi:hypothetical protein